MSGFSGITSKGKDSAATADSCDPETESSWNILGPWAMGPPRYGGFQLAMGVPPARWMVFVRENPTKMDDDWGYPYFRKPPYGRWFINYYI